MHKIIFPLFAIAAVFSASTHVPSQVTANQTVISNDNSIQAQNKTVISNMQAQNSWAFDPTDVASLVAEADAIVKVTIDRVETNTFFPKDAFIPVTPISIHITEQLSGDEQLPTTDTVYLPGGDVRVAQFIATFPERASKMELDQLSETEKHEQFIRFTTDYDYQFNVGHEYILILNKQLDGTYSIAENGYSIFTNSTTSPNCFTNVITGKVFE